MTRYLKSINIKFFATKVRMKALVQRHLSILQSYKTPYPHRLVFIAGLPKSGTTWLENLVKTVPGIRRLVCYDLENDLFEHRLNPAVLEKLPSRGNFFTKTHVEASPDSVAALREHKVPTVIMVRDLRDQCVSRFHHVLNDPSHRHHYFYLNSSREESFSHCLDIVLDEYLLWINNWVSVLESSDGLFLLVKYEDLYSDPSRVFRSVLLHFDIDLSSDDVDHIVNKVYCQSRDKRDLKRRIKNHENTLRRGGSGDWKNYFSKDDILKFKIKTNKLLIELGYESTVDW